ncbi:MAG TPA: helix-turn-helix domain-containing protein [Streptosporangiaceae bacterium]|nr:helix-turn-helix domain-containing protein [Streptosporangiaceae bacterium]HUL25994.1 helix-turn-helix domain-containing protein [Streptosporangiaceae bacterium]
MAETGLRERAKARRREAIIHAAYQLFAERGYEATTVADIAEAAEVAPRTVALYFPAKQDIALSRFSDAAAELSHDLRERPSGETLPATVGRWLRSRDARPDEVALRELARRMFEANPELRALRTARMAAAIEEGAKIISSETGDGPGAPGPRIAAVAAAAIVDELAFAPPGPDRERAITTAVRFLEAGIGAL